MKALLLINGQPPNQLPDLGQYKKIYCTDGAYAYLLSKKVRPDYVVGDFDSVEVDDISPFVEVIERPDQDFTDFYKCLEIIEEHGFEKVDVYGSTGEEHDHFLGNLSTALEFKDRLEIRFYDEYSVFFYADNELIIEDVLHHTISLMPFPKATQVFSKGLYWPLNFLDLEIGKRLGTRNVASEENVEISFEEGNLLIFISLHSK